MPRTAPSRKTAPRSARSLADARPRWRPGRGTAMLAATVLLVGAIGYLALPWTSGDGRSVSGAAAGDVPAEAGQPPLQSSPPGANLGPVETNVTITRTFELQNTSDRPLTILTARSSCTCTTVSVPQRAIPARGTLPLTAVFDSETRPGGRIVVINVTVAGYAEPLRIPLRAQVLEEDGA